MSRTQLVTKSVWCLWIAAIAALLALHAVHLRADFPNNSPWMDYSKYTDEGWYGKAAIEHYVGGSWYVHGDFNPSIALPVLPALEWIVFRFTGVSLVAARLLILAVFAANLVLAYRIVRTQAPRWAAMLAVTLLSANAFLYAFSRLAILEPLLIFFLLAAWLLALRLPRAANGMQQKLLLTGIGLLTCLTILSKTTAIFIMPSTAFLICNSYDYKFKETAKALGIAGVAASLPWSAYYLLFVHPQFAYDYRYLFAANQWMRPETVSEWLWAAWYAIHGTMWIDRWLCLIALALMLLSAIFFRSMWRNPVVGASLLTAAGYVFFIAWHENVQPRYYEVVAFPIAFVVAIGLHSLLRSKQQGGMIAVLRMPLAAVCAGIIAFSTVANVRQMIHWTRHPQYSWISAASQITEYIDQHPNGKRLLLSISGDNITLVTHLPAITDDYGTWDLAKRIHTYEPGWFATWNEVDPGTLEDIQTQYSLEQVAAYPAFDDPDRNVLILYKMHPLPANQQHYNQAFEDLGNAGR
jgi:4-amino-4-deoxy-L-arabinose transferase-like glycosyltransferase